MRLLHGDCLDLMKTIPNSSVDMVLCDLPYGVLNKDNSHAKWDVIIPTDKLWEQYNRIVKDNGAIVLFAQGMFTAQLMLSNPDNWRYNLIWDKIAPTGFLNANRAPLRRHEDIVVFYKSLPTYNPQMEIAPPHRRNHGKGTGGTQVNRCYGGFVSTPTVISDEKYPTSIIEFGKEHIIGQFYHPTQKPVNLLRYLILTYSNEGDTILDNTMGSGSTGVAAVLEKRNFIGIEKDAGYYKIARERIALAEEEMATRLF